VVRYVIGDIKLAILLEQHTQVAAVSAHDVIGTAIAALSTSALGEPSLGAYNTTGNVRRVTNNCCAFG
jgi:hypothetical protein